MPTWTSTIGAPTPTRGEDDHVAFLTRIGALDEAEALMDRLDAGTETSEPVAPADVDRRLNAICASK